MQTVLKVAWPGARAVGGYRLGVADHKARMQDLVFTPGRWLHRRIGAVLHAHQVFDLGADADAVFLKLLRFLAAVTEVQTGLNFHRLSLWFAHPRDWRPENVKTTLRRSPGNGRIHRPLWHCSGGPGWTEQKRSADRRALSISSVRDSGI